MENILNLYKPPGITPLQCIQKFKDRNPEYKNLKMGYAGRLDPMAEGVLLILIGDENKKKHHYEQLPKEYLCDVLFGIETDTYDILGKIIRVTKPPGVDKLSQMVNRIIPQFQGKTKQLYPPYSSKTINGKPLYWWARENKLNEIDIPEHQVEIFSLVVKKTYLLKRTELHKTIVERIEKVDGIFRQKEILTLWNTFFNETDIQLFPLIQCTVSCSSGTYIRQIVHDIGQKVGCGTISFNLKRTKVGNHIFKDSIQV